MFVAFKCPWLRWGKYAQKMMDTEILWILNYVTWQLCCKIRFKIEWRKRVRKKQSKNRQSKHRNQETICDPLATFKERQGEGNKGAQRSWLVPVHYWCIKYGLNALSLKGACANILVSFFLTKPTITTVIDHYTPILNRVIMRTLKRKKPVSVREETATYSLWMLEKAHFY